jgi:hypothetical protein
MDGTMVSRKVLIFCFALTAPAAVGSLILLFAAPTFGTVLLLIGSSFMAISSGLQLFVCKKP